MCNRLPEINKNGDAGIFPVYYSLNLLNSIHNVKGEKVFKKNLNAAKPPEKSKCLGRNIGCKADSYAYEKLIRKWTKSVFFGFFQSYGYENGPDSYGQIRLSFL